MCVNAALPVYPHGLFLQFDAAVEAAEAHVVRFGKQRDRVMGDYFVEPTAEERAAAVKDSLPRISKRMGLRPEDVGASLLAHLHDAVTKPPAAGPV